MGCRTLFDGLKIYVVIVVCSLVLGGGEIFAEELSGTVIETMNSGSYTYVQLEKDGKRQWVAVPESLVRVGDDIELAPGVSMGSYTSPTLGRSFEDIIFSGGIKQIRKRVVSGRDDGKEKVALNAEIEKAKGDNAYRIEEIFAKKGELDGKSVTVRGQVVKTSQYQGKTWIRIVDGTGSRKRGNHKLIVTSDSSADKDTVITVRGTVRADKSYGALSYEVVVEDAELVK